LVVGNTEVGVEARFKGSPFHVRIGVASVPELNVIEFAPPPAERKSGAKGGKADGHMTFGASVTLTTMKERLTEWGARSGLAPATRSLIDAYLTQLKWFSSNQIRNAACIGGNIVTASPIADLNPLFLATGAVFELSSAKGGRRRVAATDFFREYRRVNINDEEVLELIVIPLSNDPFEFFASYKQSRR
jgi:xanthine dehydrogenase/oxidase